jgi:hypothetical protein
MTIIQSFIDEYDNSEYDVIFCGDFNARMGTLTGDYRTTNTTQTPRTNNRGNLMLPLIINNGLTLWNQKLCYGIPTYLTGSTNSNTNMKSSIIDLFLTPKTENFLCPEMSIATHLSLGSDHKLITFAFQYHFNQSTVITEQQQPRKLWKIKKFKPQEKRVKSDSYEKNILNFIDTPQSSPSDTTPSQQAETQDTGYEQDNKYIYNYRKKIIYFFENRVEPLFEDPSPSIDSINTTIVESIQQALDSSVGEQNSRKKHWRWFWNEHLQQESAKREQLYKKWTRARNFNKIEFWKSHLDQSEKVRSLIKHYKNKYFRSFCNKLLTDEYSKTLQKLKTIRRSRDQNVTFQHENGPAAAAEIMVTKLNDIFKGPQDNILDTLNRHSNINPSIFDGINTSTNYTTESIYLSENNSALPFTINTVQQCIKDLPTNKAPGIDHLKAEMFKPIDDILSTILFKLFGLCWKQGKTPTDWNIAQVVPIYKKGDPTDAANYRPISLISTLRKIFEFCLYPALLKISPIIDVAQGGFRNRRSTLDQALNLHQIMIHQKKVTKSQQYVAFLDIKSAYDSVNRNIIWNSLQEHGKISTHFLNILKYMFDNIQVQVLLSGHRSSNIHPESGILQGSTLSPHLYSIFINSLPTVIRKSISEVTSHININPTFSIRYPSDPDINLGINTLLFADDVALITTKEKLQHLLNISEQHSLLLNYRWNPKKCAILVPDNSTDVEFKLYQETVPTVTIFKYLGIYFNSKGIDSKSLITGNAAKAINSMKTLHFLGANHNGFDKFLSIKLYKSFIRPILEYGISIIKSNKKDFKLLEDAQDQCIRLIFNGHKTSSTKVIRHLNNTPAMDERMVTLTAKNIFRVINYQQQDALITLVNKKLQRESYITHWTFLQNHNPIWRKIKTYLQTNAEASFGAQLKQLKTETIEWRKQNLLEQQSKQTYLGLCNSKFRNDPIMFIPMSNFERSRVLRWKMGWLPGKPQVCRNCLSQNTNNRTTRAHLTTCLQIHNELNMSIIYISPIDEILNQLPRYTVTNSWRKNYWRRVWPIVCELLYKIEQLCLPADEEVNTDPIFGDPFLQSLKP